MPDKEDKVQTNFRLTTGVLRRLDALADELELERAAVVDMAIKNLWGCKKRDLQPFLFDPPPPPKDTPRGKKESAS